MSQTQTPITAAGSDPAATLALAVRKAAADVLGLRADDIDPLIKPSQSPQFGDYQSNLALPMAKQLGRNPRDLAQQIVERVTPLLADIVEPPDVAGPGFVNFRFKPAALAELLDAMNSAALGVTPDRATAPVAIDLCGVNVAKQMHVGHLRSTIIGDALARVLERRGRTVFRENHLGDWGLPIAMVLYQLRRDNVDLDALTLDDLDAAYRRANTSDDPADHDAARRTLVQLQQGEPDLVRDWQKLIDCTMRAVYDSLDLLNVKLSPENNRGESFYRDRLADVIDTFVRKGAAEEDDGALVVRFDDRERPLLIRKSDGGFLYATTDLAAVRYRTHELGASRVIYVVDARQRDHFRDVFDAARTVGWDITPEGDRAELVHIPFGAVLGTDGKPLKTRSGENVTLRSLIDEAIERGSAEVMRRAADDSAPTHGLDDSELRQIGRSVGIGAVKFADLSNDLVRDYVFDMDRMIAFEGKTGPYIQYAHARICSIFNRSDAAEADWSRAPFALIEDAERHMALKLLQYASTVAGVASELEPHRLCTYLYDLANLYAGFYQHCPVLKTEDDALVRSRLRLCDLTRRVLADGLGLLGIDAPQRM